MDKITELNKRLQEIKDSFDLWKNSGLNEEIMIVYLAAKLGIAKKDVKNFLNEQEKFFNDLIKAETVKKLEK